MSKCHAFNTRPCFSIIASSAGPQSTAARAGNSTSLWSRREPTGQGLCPSDGVNMTTEASLSILKIELNSWVVFIFFFCEDQPPKVCAICCDLLTLSWEGNLFCCPSHHLWQFCNYWLLCSLFHSKTNCHSFSMEFGFI